MKFVVSDGGRVEAGIQDTADCAVRAYAHYHGVPYAEAHALFMRLGRKRGKGTPWKVIFEAMKVKPDVHWTEKHKQVTLNQLLAMYPKGRVYAIKRGHAFALVDGVLMDTWKVGPKSRVFTYWVQQESQQADEPAKQVKDKRTEALAICANHHTVLTTAELINKISIELNITKANARYYVTRVFVK